MECPACKETMVILEYEAVEVDYCVACHGVWLDSGELELLFGDRTQSDGFMKSGTSAAGEEEAPRPCPICSQKMGKAATGGPQPVTYDSCDDGHGLWFDQGELTTILKHGSPAEGGEAVAKWLREMFHEREEDGATRE
jgi:Zn-finger nucleic acid-binding protein